LNSCPGYQPSEAPLHCGQTPSPRIASQEILIAAENQFIIFHIFALENIANLDKLPASGATLYMIHMLIKEGTGSPVRVFVILP